ncbi:hypothetical protein REPUB_Repub09cG0209300 [Reevesia pubescens]
MQCEMQKEVFKAVKIDTRQPPYVFKCLLYYLTGVPPERQKIMVKGGLLKDDADWSSVGVKQRKKLMMMGTADEVFKALEKGTVFIEDLSEGEQVVALKLLEVVATYDFLLEVAMKIQHVQQTSADSFLMSWLWLHRGLPYIDI